MRQHSCPAQPDLETPAHGESRSVRSVAARHGTGLMKHQYVYVTPLPFELVRKSDLERARLVALRT
jgi:hypothetical protein